MHRNDLHKPERLPGETQDQYRTRQRASKRAADSAPIRELAADGWALTGQSLSLSSLGNQHHAPSQRERMRDAQRSKGKGPRGTFAFGIVNAAAKKLADSKAHKAKHPRRDADGAYTQVGDTRRMWLAGISARRGY